MHGTTYPTGTPLPDLPELSQQEASAVFQMSEKTLRKYARAAGARRELPAGRVNIDGNVMFAWLKTYKPHQVPSYDILTRLRELREAATVDSPVNPAPIPVQTVTPTVAPPIPTVTPAPTELPPVAPASTAARQTGRAGECRGVTEALAADRLRELQTQLTEVRSGVNALAKYGKPMELPRKLRFWRFGAAVLFGMVLTLTAGGVILWNRLHRTRTELAATETVLSETRSMADQRAGEIGQLHESLKNVSKSLQDEIEAAEARQEQYRLALRQAGVENETLRAKLDELQATIKENQKVAPESKGSSQ